jgi:hypothetical protein
VNQSHDPITCEQFQRQLADLIARDANIYTHPHLQTCDRCRRFIIDLEMIAENGEPGDRPSD